jgi:transcriptional regulator with XRE-family HTH domain
MGRSAAWPVELGLPDDGTALGARIRARRKALGKTMQQVADEAGLTIGFISQIERGISTPSLSSLYNVAKALDCSVDMFVAQPPSGRHNVVTRAGKRPLFEAGTGNTRFYEFLEPGFAEAKLNACLTHVLPGHASEMMSHDGEDFIYLVAGHMLYEVDGVSYELGAGDTLHFDAHKPHRRTNIGAETAIELWVGTMQLFQP